MAILLRCLKKYLLDNRTSSACKNYNLKYFIFSKTKRTQIKCHNCWVTTPPPPEPPPPPTAPAHLPFGETIENSGWNSEEYNVFHIIVSHPLSSLPSIIFYSFHFLRIFCLPDNRECHSFVCPSWIHLLCYFCNGLKQEFTLLSCDIKERFSLIIQIQNDATQHCSIRQSCWLYTDCGRQTCPLTVQIQNVNTKGDTQKNTIQDNNRKYVRFYVFAWEVTFEDF